MEENVIDIYMKTQCKTLIQFCVFSENLNLAGTSAVGMNQQEKAHYNKITVICHSDFPGAVTRRAVTGKCCDTSILAFTIL